MTLLDRYHGYIQQLHRSGVPTTRYDCPSCHRQLESRTPAAGEEPTDTLAQCPYCLADYFLVVPDEGAARVRLLEGFGYEPRREVVT